MKIFINGFWDGFLENTDPNKSFVLFYILQQIFNEKIIISNLNNSEVLLESVFSDKTYINYKKWKYTFLFNGESVRYLIDKKYERFLEIPKYNCILSGRHTDMKKKIINFPLFVYYIYSNNYLAQLTNSIKIENVPKKKICAVISNGNSSERNYFLNKLEEKISIDYAGRYKNNIPRIEGDYNSNEIINFYSQYKFVICLENTKQETYITEKIINGFLAKTIPIYWGSDMITYYFNSERFINISNFDDNTINSIIDRIELIINNDDEYLNIVNKEIFKNNYLNRTINDIFNDIKELLQL
jgi:hypothetical protein